MKTNAILRIILWSLVIVILLSILLAGMGFNVLRRDTALAETMVSLEEAPAIQNRRGTATAVVNIRKTPTSTGEVVGVLDKGEPVQVLRTETVNGQEWGYLPDYEGWVVMDYVNIEEALSSSSTPIAQVEETISGEPAYAVGNGAHFSTQDVSRISIDWLSGKITVEPADVTDIIVQEENPDSKYPTSFQIKNGKLTIDFCKDNSITGWAFSLNLGMHTKKDLTIYVPRGFSLKELELDAASTDLEVRGLTIGEVEIDTASGASTFINCNMEKLDVDTASGDVIFKGSLNQLDFDAASASFEGVFTNVPSRMEVDSASGDLDVTLPPEAGFTVKQDGMSSKFSSEFDTVNRNGSYVHGDGACRIEMDAMSGDITIRMGAAADPEPSTVLTAPDAPTSPTAPEAPTTPEAPTAP